jgi:cytochrome c biogenesis protein CcmG, thiol:disulfide interchange protein DsbE
MENPVSKSTNELEGSPVMVGRERRRLPVWVIVLAFAVLVGFMALIGWGLNRSMRGSIQMGDPVPSFTMATFDGKTIQTSDYAGKVIVLNFWASWCKPCEQEARELEEAYQHYKDGEDVVFLGLAYVDTEPNSLTYLSRFGVTYPNGPDLATKVSQMFRVRGVPETFIIDREGRLAYFKAGPFTTLDEILVVIDGILQK